MRDFAILLLVICAVVIALLVSMQHRPQVEFPMVDAAMPLIAPVRSSLCNVAPPAPPLERTA